MNSAGTSQWRTVTARAAAVMLALIGSSDVRAQNTADLVVRDAAIWTGAGAEATALAVEDGRIVFVGDSVDAKRYVGASTTVLDLAGRRVVPGFYDSHAHLLLGGLQLSRARLRDCADEAEFGRRLAEYDRNLPPGRWLQGDFDHDRTFGGQVPTAEFLDRYVGDRPVLLTRYDGHMAVANSKALEAARISPDTPDPPGGLIHRRPGGLVPAGALGDNAIDLVSRLIPSPTEDEIAEAVLKALDESRRVGVTSVQDMAGGGSEQSRHLLRLYRRLADAGRMTARIDLRWPLAEFHEAARLVDTEGPGDEWIRIGGVKGFVDGSLGSSTAKFFEPYEAQGDYAGLFVTSPARLQDLVTGADAAGMSVAVHAIGDEANKALLDVYEKVANKNGPRDRRLRIEHVQHLQATDYPRFAAQGVAASMQPYHAVDDGRWAEGRIGTERCASSYAFRSLLDAVAPLAFGSDWPVAPLDPLAGIDAAVNRRTLDGKHPQGWFPEQRITVEEALLAYTLGSAKAAFTDADRGTLEVGKLADFVVLTADILDPANRDRIGETKVEMTIVGGKTVFNNRPDDR